MKKKIISVMVLVCITGLCGCSGKANTGATHEATEILNAGGDVGEEVSSEMISSDELGSGIYNALEKEWAAWNEKSEEQKMFSSHLPGHCYRQFDDWTECEEFLGFCIPNPLESSEWLEKGTYVGMPLGFADASRFYVSFYGTQEGQIEWIHVDSGYRDGEIRVTVNAQVEVDKPAETADAVEPLITEDSGERYVARETLVVQGPVTYSIRVIGEPGMLSKVQETMEKVLPYFYDTMEKENVDK